MKPELEEVRKSLTLTEVGVIFSIGLSAITGVFTLGVIYGQVQQNSSDIKEIKPKVEDITVRLERIDTNVEYLTEQAREARQGRD